MSDAFAIQTNGLRKSYETVEALKGLDLEVPRGSICGFLGRNGSGKTTTMKILLGMTHATAGTARVFGLACDAPDANVEIRRRTGFVSEEKDLYDFMTVGEIVRFTASFYPRWRTDLEERYLRAFELPPGRRIKALSRGMRTKLSLLLALCRSADLLVLDEPTSGLDPAMIEEMLQAIVSHVASEEATVFFSSHQIAEVEQIADRVTIIDRGRAVLSGSLDDLREGYRRLQLVFDGAAPEAGLRSPGVLRVRREGRVLTVLANAGADRIREEARAMGARSIDEIPVTLKEIFLETVAGEED
ncbi:MAG: ATP-binding cassette domain-containing protein [Candidatus Eiseniibacteriota bacterium]